MIIQALMTPRDEVHWVNPLDTLGKALEDLEKHGFTTLPVLDNGGFLGVITRRSIFETFFKGDEPDRERFLTQNLVKDHIITDVQVARITDFLDEALLQFLNSRYDFLPVLSGDRFMGIVTRNNVIGAFMKGAGLEKASHRVAVPVDDFRGSLARLTSLISDEGADILGIVSFHARAVGLRFVEITVGTERFGNLVKVLAENGFNARESRMAKR
jgi:acetoin utilization protein AcuB